MSIQNGRFAGVCRRYSADFSEFLLKKQREEV